MQPPTSFNTRYILEQERDRLLEEQRAFDDRYGSVSFALVAGVETLALLAYLCIAAALTCRRRHPRTRSDAVVVLWALINFVVLLKKLSVYFGTAASEESLRLADMVAAAGRSYGAAAGVAWLFAKYWGAPKPRYDLLVYFLVWLPAIACGGFIWYYFAVNPFIYEVYGPGSDVLHVMVYVLVGVACVTCKTFASTRHEVAPYVAATALANLVANFPLCLMTIYVRFNLDAAWVYRLHMNFVDVAVDLFSCLGAFVVLLVVGVYEGEQRKRFEKKKEGLLKNDAVTLE